MMNAERLVLALETLGQVLLDRGLAYELVAIGGGALLLHEIVPRPTEDIDIVARVDEGTLVFAHPFPGPLADAIRQVGLALSLPVATSSEKDWLNPGPAVLLRLGLPRGFEERLEKKVYGGLTLHLASRYDLIHLKVWAATSSVRSLRFSVDVEDLRALQPTKEEMRAAITWCARLDGRDDFVETEARPLLDELGIRWEPDDD